MKVIARESERWITHSAKTLEKRCLSAWVKPGWPTSWEWYVSKNAWYGQHRLPLGPTQTEKVDKRRLEWGAPWIILTSETTIGWEEISLQLLQVRQCELWNFHLQPVKVISIHPNSLDRPLSFPCYKEHPVSLYLYTAKMGQGRAKYLFVRWYITFLLGISKKFSVGYVNVFMTASKSYQAYPLDSQNSSCFC